MATYELEPSRYLHWWLRIALAFALLVALADAFRSFVLGIVSPFTLLLDAVSVSGILTAQVLVARGRLRQASALFTTIIMGNLVVSSTLYPDYDLIGFLLLPPALIVALLPYFRGRVLAIFVTCSLLLEAQLATQLVWRGPLKDIPFIHKVFIVVIVLAMAGALLSVLPEYTSRLRTHVAILRNSEARLRALAHQRKLAELRLQFLLHASEELAGPLSSAQVLQRVIELAVPLLADEARFGPVTRSSSSDYASLDLRLELAAAGEVLGELHLHRADLRNAFCAADVEVGRELCRLAGIALERARLRERLEASIVARDEFLSIASHELKTPLTPLRLHLAAWKRKHPELRVEPLERQVIHLQALVESMLDLSRLRHGKLVLELKDVDYAALARAVVERESMEVARSGSTLELEIPTTLPGRSDPIRFDQVLTNLISNAVKYGRGGPLRLSVREQGRWLLLRLEDQGIGIAEEHQPHIFERFERAVSSRHYGGLGLGLYLTRLVVEALGGDISLVSTLGVGSTFTVVLPRYAEAQSAVLEPQPPPHEAHAP